MRGHMRCVCARAVPAAGLVNVLATRLTKGQPRAAAALRSDPSFAQGGTPLFLAQDDIQFRKPVEIGSLLLLDARIDLARGAPHRSFQVAVTADVLDSRTGRRDTTNVFYFTFIVNDKPLRRVMPHSYAESIRYLAARRRLAAGSAAYKAHLQHRTPWVLPSVPERAPPAAT